MSEEVALGVDRNPTWSTKRGCLNYEGLSQESNRPGCFVGCAITRHRVLKEADGKEDLCFGPDGEPAQNNWGYHRVVVTTTENRSVRAHFGIDGEPVDPRKGAHQTVMISGDGGSLASVAYFDRDDKPVLGGDGFHRRDNTTNFDGITTGYRYFDRLGELTPGPGGVAAMKLELSPSNKKMVETFFGPDDQPALGRGGYAQIRYERNERGQKTAESYFDADLEPLAVAGCPRRVFFLDDGGTFIGRGCRSSEGDPVPDERMGGIATDERQQSDGETRVIAFFDGEEQSVPGNNGWAKLVRKLDARGNATEVRLYGVDGAPWMGPDGDSGALLSYDAFGNMTEVEFLNATGKPGPKLDGIQSRTTRYDDRKRRIETAWHPAPGETDGRSLTEAYNKRDQLIRVACTNDNGTPGLIPWAAGIHEETWSYDAQGWRSGGTRVAPDGTGAISAGVVGWKAERDRGGRPQQLSLVDRDGQPVVATERVVIALDGWRDGQELAVPAGVASLKVAYHDRHNPSQMSFFDENGAPVSGSKGCKILAIPSRAGESTCVQ